MTKQIINYNDDCETEISTYRKKNYLDNGTVNEFNNANIKLYPNPNNGLFTVLFDAKVTDNYNIEVYSVLGIKLHQQAVTNMQTLNLSHFQNATYLIVFVNNGTKVKTEHLLITK